MDGGDQWPGRWPLENGQTVIRRLQAAPLRLWSFGQFEGGDDVARLTKRIRSVGIMGILAGMLGAPSIATAQTPLSFDCDAPVDQFSTDAQVVTLPVTVVGTVSTLGMASKDYVPSASLAIVSADDRNGVGFQMNAATDDATELDVDLIEMQRGVIKETPQGRVRATGAVPFALAVSRLGDVTVTVGAMMFKTKLAPVASVKVAATCTSGHFKYLGSLSNATAATLSQKP